MNDDGRVGLTTARFRACTYDSIVACCDRLAVHAQKASAQCIWGLVVALQMSCRVLLLLRRCMPGLKGVVQRCTINSLEFDTGCFRARLPPSS